MMNIRPKVSEKMPFLYLAMVPPGGREANLKKSLHLFVGTVPRNNCTKFQKNPVAAVGGDGRCDLSKKLTDGRTDGRRLNQYLISSAAVLRQRS